MKLLEDLGRQFATKTSKRKERYGIYECTCGSKFKARKDSIDSQRTKSCGCLLRKKTIDRCLTHGLSSHPLYSVWGGMLNRCYSQNSGKFNYYGGRGIKVCDRWLDIKNFVEDMYPTFEEGLSIDRINNDGNYEPDNCRWTSQTIQMRNSRRIKSTNTSGYRGVYFNKQKKKWTAQITHSYRYVFLGDHDTAIEAAMAYDRFVLDNNLEHTINYKKEK